MARQCLLLGGGGGGVRGGLLPFGELFAHEGSKVTDRLTNVGSMQTVRDSSRLGSPELADNAEVFAVCTKTAPNAAGSEPRCPSDRRRRRRASGTITLSCGSRGRELCDLAAGLDPLIAAVVKSNRSRRGAVCVTRSRITAELAPSSTASVTNVARGEPGGSNSSLTSTPIRAANFARVSHNHHVRATGFDPLEVLERDASHARRELVLRRRDASATRGQIQRRAFGSLSPTPPRFAEESSVKTSRSGTI